jgi:hypothetical protein
MTSSTTSRRKVLTLVGGGAAMSAAPFSAPSTATSQADDAELMKVYAEFRRIDAIAIAADYRAEDCWHKDKALTAESERLDALSNSALARFTAAPAKTPAGFNRSKCSRSLNGGEQITAGIDRRAA